MILCTKYLFFHFQELFNGKNDFIVKCFKKLKKFGVESQDLVWTMWFDSLKLITI
jgi:hypothetical protein